MRELFLKNDPKIVDVGSLKPDEVVLGFSGDQLKIVILSDKGYSMFDPVGNRPIGHKFPNISRLIEMAESKGHWSFSVYRDGKPFKVITESNPDILENLPINNIIQVFISEKLAGILTKDPVEHNWYLDCGVSSKFPRAETRKLLAELLLNGNSKIKFYTDAPY